MNDNEIRQNWLQEKLFHLKKFINAGNFVEGELLPTDHNLANLNTDNFVLDAIEDIMGL